MIVKIDGENQRLLAFSKTRQSNKVVIFKIKTLLNLQQLDIQNKKKKTRESSPSFHPYAIYLFLYESFPLLTVAFPNYIYTYKVPPLQQHP